MKNYLISDILLRGLIAYLETKPFKEVAQALQVLQSLPEVRSDSDAPQPAEKSE